jgi:hypothetical protein
MLVSLAPDISHKISTALLLLSLVRWVHWLWIQLYRRNFLGFSWLLLLLDGWQRDSVLHVVRDEIDDAIEQLI